MDGFCIFFFFFFLKFISTYNLHLEINFLSRRTAWVAERILRWVSEFGILIRTYQLRVSHLPQYARHYLLLSTVFFSTKLASQWPHHWLQTSNKNETDFSKMTVTSSADIIVYDWTSVIHLKQKHSSLIWTTQFSHRRTLSRLSENHGCSYHVNNGPRPDGHTTNSWCCPVRRIWNIFLHSLTVQA